MNPVEQQLNVARMIKLHQPRFVKWLMERRARNFHKKHNSAALYERSPVEFWETLELTTQQAAELSEQHAVTALYIMEEAERQFPKRG